jgi:hypothetical protein
LKAQLEKKLVGTWKGAGRRFDENWIVAQDGTALKITATYWKDGKQVGSCHGTNISYGQDHLTFRRVFDKKPDSKLSNSTIGIFKVSTAWPFLPTGR